MGLGVPGTAVSVLASGELDGLENWVVSTTMSSDISSGQCWFHGWIWWGMSLLEGVIPIISAEQW